MQRSPRVEVPAAKESPRPQASLAWSSATAAATTYKKPALWHQIFEALALFDIKRPVSASHKGTKSYAGMGIADLVARPVGRHILRPEQPNRAWDILKKKFRRGPDYENQIYRFGLKVFP